MCENLQAISSRRCGPVTHARQLALTLVELLLAVAIIGMLAAFGYSSYQQYMDKVRVAQAQVDIRGIEAVLERFYANRLRFPETLAEAGVADMRDPWNQPYRYLNIQTAGPSVRGQVRKDRNLVPINADYDLYSMGKDRQTRPPLTARVSHDDVIRANNGAFVGLASDY